MFKILKSKRRNIPLIYLIVFLLLLYATFLPIYRTGDPRRTGYIESQHITIGYHFTHVALIFYLIGVILLFLRRPIASFVLTAIGNFWLSGSIIYFLYEVATIEKGEAYAILYGFYILVSLWIFLIILNILMIKFKSELSVRPRKDQPVNT